MGDSQTGENLYHRSPPTGVKVLSHMSGFPTWVPSKSSSKREVYSNTILPQETIKISNKQFTPLGVKEPRERN